MLGRRRRGRSGPALELLGLVLALSLTPVYPWHARDDYDYETAATDGGDVDTDTSDTEDKLLEGDKAAVPWASLCPPPVQPPSCGTPPCSSNSDCAPRHNNTYLCCFNGCVHTCMRALDPPPVFDWIEEPPDVTVKGGEVARHSSPPETVALPGGCLLTEAEFLSLEGFKQNKHVSHCFCDIGGVFCKIVH